MNSKVLTFKTPSNPYSSDPIDYDAEIHHIVFTSVLSTLVSQYEANKFTGIIADHWTTSSDQSQWTFHIRKDIAFETGELISPSIIVQSLTRILFLLQQKESKSSLLSHLLGISHLNSPTSSISGLTFDNEKVHFKFIKPMPNLLQTISFGIYSIAHPTSYDSKTGQWLNKKKVISSGPYRINKWTSQDITLILNSEFTLKVGHEKKFKEVVISWSKTLKEFDLTFDQSKYYSKSNNLYFLGSFDASIGYIHCLSWDNPKSPFHDINFRRKIRKDFYTEAIKSKKNYVKSFFPLSMMGIKEVVTSERSVSIPSSLNLVASIPIIPMTRTTSFEINQLVQKALSHSKVQVQKKEISLESRIKHLEPSYNHDIDISPMRTAILISDPMGDINFMFRSKEGIRLPDSTGEINELLEQGKVNAQRINEILWEQAIIWPLDHNITGYWAKPHVDLTMINMAMPPTNFAWIGIN
ncbi:MAG: hypothetical protein KAG61_01930 [Bacteriovoracaceae bacterium]|nr:hypothetical protein [Bacteriovoracaceae bacterium]